MSENKEESEINEMAAIELSIEAKNEIIKICKDFYGDHIFLQGELLLKIMNRCLVLSMQKIEEKAIKTRLIIIDELKMDRTWPKDTVFIRFEPESYTNLKLTEVKKYLAATEAHNIAIVLNASNMENQKDIKLIGLLAFKESIKKFASQFKLWELNPEKYEEHLGCIYNSLLISIDNGKVILSFLDRKLLEIEKGIIAYRYKISEFIYRLFMRSRFYNLTEDYQLQGLPYLVDEYYSIFQEIIIKISDGRHGAILIFCYEGEINDESYFHPNAINVKVPIVSFLQDNKYPIRDKEDIKDILNMYKDLIVSLSRTDGALIFNENLDLILAGAFLKVEESSIGIGGARRKSAEAFSKRIKKMGISISQDGSIHLFDFLPKDHLDKLREKVGM